MRSRANGKTAFTLIELLVVLTVIAILAALGMSNYQYATIRGKTARVQSDMRTICSALESYRIDEGTYPHAAIGDMQLPQPLLILTHPTAYITALPQDPFGPAPYDFSDAIVAPGYQYKDRLTTAVGMPGETYGAIWRDLPARQYFLHSSGPNLIWDVTPYAKYDASNGVVSRGDIIRFGPM